MLRSSGRTMLTRFSIGCFGHWPPNALTSIDYAEDFNEVKELGSLTSVTRTMNQTDAAIFWQDHAHALFNRMFRALAAKRAHQYRLRRRLQRSQRARLTHKRHAD